MPSTAISTLSSPSALLSRRAKAGSSSAIRDLLSQAKQPGMISLAGGLPDPALFPTIELSVIAQRILAERGREVLQYGETAGSPILRERFAAALPGVVADDVIITTGSQQGLDLIARTILDDGDMVVVGDPEYLGALQVFRTHGAHLQSVPVDADGLDVDHLEYQLVGGLRPKACYIVANFHNPTGASMSRARRLQLAALADRYGFLVIEDDPYRDIFFDAAPVSPECENPNRYVRLRSVSKTLSPGLRVGAMAVPRWLLEPVVIAKQSCDLHTSTVSQAIAADAMAASWYPPHLAEIRSVYRTKRDVLIRALEIEFAGRLSFSTPAGGMFLWVDLDAGDTMALLPKALEQGMCFVPGEAFGLPTHRSSWARLSFATASAEDLVEGVGRLAAATK